MKIKHLFPFLVVVALITACRTTKSNSLPSASSVNLDSIAMYTSNGMKHVKGSGEDMEYRRNSLCSILVRHPEKNYDKDISAAFAQIPIPEKYNSHNLSIREVYAAKKSNDKTYKGNKNIEKTIEPFIQKQEVAKLLVSKWFNRRSYGTFDMDLVKERGLYDADYFDEQLAAQSLRKQSLLADAGEDLIGNTFVIFNDITYLDKEEAALWASVGVIVASSIMQAATDNVELKNSYRDLEKSITDFNDQIGGFRVTIHSHLYRLRWDETTASTFYSEYYISEPNATK